MLWFLRLFPQFRSLASLAEMQARAVEDCDRKAQSLEHDVASLREANQELVNEKALLEDRLATALEDKERLWNQAQSALEAERYALHTMVNHAVQKNGGGIPFSEAHSLPPNEVRKIQTPGPIGRRGRILPSELAQRKTNEFVTSYMETMGETEKAAS